jgi:protein TonB
MVTWLTSLAIHALAVAFFMTASGGAALEEGSGADSFVVEQGIAIEGVSKIGDAEVDVQAVEAPPQVLQSSPPIDEVKPVEQDEQHVIGSDEGPEQEKVVKEPEPDKVQEPKPKQMAAVEQTEAPVDEKKAAGAKQSGGDVTAMSAYRGKLFAHLSGKKVNPRSRKQGTVVIQFTVGPQGDLISREVTSSSGSKILDDAAVASIDHAAPFPPMPSEAGTGPLVVSVPFKFSVR